ncbi:MAG: DUF523 domain-containing protein [Sulfurimonas sp.]|jgi:uncharacterized protein YbbK (DUF523 family)
MSKKKVIISACLLGENCRYDGSAKISNEVIERYKDYEIIPFCPEAPIFGTPRERISVVEVDGNYRIITDDTNMDVTKLLEDEINFFINSNPEVDEIVLKSKSPSCGSGTTPILNQRKEALFYGDGIAARIFKKKYKNTKIKDEKSV